MNQFNTQYQPTNPFLAQSAVYRYGFNGKEKLSLSDPNDGQIDFGARVGHSLLGRMWSLDAKDQFDSDYVHSGNSPISGVDPDGNYFFRLFGSTSAQRQRARLYQKVFGGKIENLMKESVHVAKQMRGEDFNYGGDWFLQSDGSYMFQYGKSTGVTVSLQVTYFDYNSGTPISYNQNPSKENSPPGLEIHGETIKLGATELMSLNLEGSSDGANYGGELAGEDGLRDYSDAMGKTGAVLEKIPPTAFIGKTLSLISLTIDQSLDYKNLSPSDANKKLFTRLSFLGIGYGLGKVLPQPGFSGHTALDQTATTTVDLALDLIEEKATE